MPNEHGRTVALQDRSAVVAWTPSDVLTKAGALGLTVTEAQACDFLERNQKYIRDDMIARGWDSIETLLLDEAAGKEPTRDGDRR